MRWVALLLILCSSAHAIDPSDTKVLDVTLSTGLITGTAKLEDPTNGDTEFDYGGFPFIIGVNFDIQSWFTLSVMGHFVTDFFNIQITRTGLDLQAAFHVVGGARRINYDFGEKTRVMVREASNIALLLRLGFHSYGVTEKTTGLQLQGGLFDVKIGAQYRFDLSQATSLTFEGLITGMSLPAGVNRISTTLIVFNGGIRFFL